MKVPHGFKTFALSVFEWPLKTGFNVLWLNRIHVQIQEFLSGGVQVNLQKKLWRFSFVLFFFSLQLILQKSND